MILRDILSSVELIHASDGTFMKASLQSSAQTPCFGVITSPAPRFTILKAVRERVFDKYDGVNNWKLVKKKGHQLIYLSLLGDDLLEMHPVG